MMKYLPLKETEGNGMITIRMMTSENVLLAQAAHETEALARVD